MSVLTLNRDKWKKFKDDNNLSKSRLFNKADVGPTIDSFQKSLDSCKKSPGKESLATCVTKVSDLNKDFKKFIDLKETKDQLEDPAKKQLELGARNSTPSPPGWRSCLRRRKRTWPPAT